MTSNVAQPAPDAEPPAAFRRRRGRRAVAVGAVIVVVAAGAVIAVKDPFHHSAPSGNAAASDGYPTGLQPIMQGTVTEQTQVSGTLGYGGSYSIKGGTGQVITWLPGTGAVIRQGQVLYRVNYNRIPIVLLYGSLPLYRQLSVGMTGGDVRQLNRNLVTLGYASRSVLNPHSYYFSYQTAYALELMQKHYGLPVTGYLPLGQMVFLPSAIQVDAVPGALGSTDTGVVLQGSTTSRLVTIPLDVSEQTEVKLGDKVTITLPNGTNTPGVVTSIGTVAATTNSGTTINVQVTLNDPAAAGRLTSAPVQVSIVTASASNVLSVPVDALLATVDGGYAVEEPTARGTRRIIPVTLGLFDNAAGTVQVTGPGLAAGQQVVVPQL
jgi:peptidoglycan hydrolase-like protein with peptidoglycan-binding domain